jgi:acyl CoA:acetate/3-ketoacid CoA transferase beta subunit
LLLREAFPGLTADDIRSITDAEFAVSSTFGPMRL